MDAVGFISPVTFTSLPQEILCVIFPLLDPIALISLSQVSQYFRQLIDPQREHFVHRLLALELIPAHGGPVPIHHVRTRRLEPSLQDAAAWSNIRFACAGCLKIRSHIHFGDPAISRRGLRKPPPGSRAASQLCGWDSGSTRAKALRQQARRQAEALKLARWRAIQHRSTRQMPDDPDEAMAIEQEEERAELELCGLDRERRKCNECMYQQGFWGRLDRPSEGPARLPIAKSRSQWYPHKVERYFPGFLLEDGGLELSLGGSLGRSAVFDIWMARCPHCGIWQELAAFLLESPSELYKKPDASCHKCRFARTGLVDFSNTLREFWVSMIYNGPSWYYTGTDAFWHEVAIYLQGFRDHPVTWKDLCDEWGPASPEEREKVINGWPFTHDEPSWPLPAHFLVWLRFVDVILKPSGAWHSDSCFELRHRTEAYAMFHYGTGVDVGPLVEYVLREHDRFAAYG